MLGLTQVQKGSYVTLCICRLMLASISSENSTTLLGIPTYPDRSSSLVLDSLMPTRLSAVPCWLALSVVCHQLLPQAPLSNSLSHSLTTSGHVKIAGPKPFGFAPKQTKESSAWQTTYIVLQYFIFYNPFYVIAFQLKPEIKLQYLQHINVMLNVGPFPSFAKLFDAFHITGHDAFPFSSFFYVGPIRFYLLIFLEVYWEIVSSLWYSTSPWIYLPVNLVMCLIQWKSYINIPQSPSFHSWIASFCSAYATIFPAWIFSGGVLMV